MPTCSSFYQGHVVEVSVFSQASLYHIFSVGQLLQRDRRNEQLLALRGSWKGYSLTLGAYRVIFIGNGSPLHQARDDLGREEMLALAGDWHNAVL